MPKNTLPKLHLLILITIIACLYIFKIVQADHNPQLSFERLESLYDPMIMIQSKNPLSENLIPEGAVPSLLNNWSKTVFQRVVGNNFEVHIADGSNTNILRLTGNNGSSYMPRLNRGNTAIAFVSNRTGKYQIFTMDINGGNLQQLTTISDNLLPDWSPDGRMILFASERDGQSEIYVMDANGSNQVRLTDNLEYDGQPSWSPDGSKILFISQRNGQYGVWVMNVDGSGQIQLSNQPYGNYPHFSPDGSVIAYNADGDNDGWLEIYVMNADGSNQTELTQNGGNASWGIDYLVSDWSPDQSYILYSHIYWINYSGQWYWDYAIRYGLSYPDIVGVQLGDSHYDWRADWETTDLSAPISNLTPLPDPSPGPIPLQWTGNDPGGAGIEHYDIQYSQNPNGPWEDLFIEGNQTSLDFTATGGQTFYFRLRAVDHALNKEDWQLPFDTVTTVEAVPPTSWVSALSPFTRGIANIFWNGFDTGGSDIESFTIQYKMDNGDWSSWHVNTQTTSDTFTGDPGATYYFRSSAVDTAQNVEAVPIGLGDTQTSFYTWAITGTVTDNSGALLSGSLPAFQAGGVGGYASNPMGIYYAYGANEEEYHLSWSQDGYANLPFTSFDSIAEGLQNIVFPPSNNIVQNWGFESGTFGSGDWQPSGIIPSSIITKSHTGSYAALLGEDLTFAPTYLLNSDASGMKIDDAGNIYMMWTKTNYPSGPNIYFREKLNGAWHPKEVFQTDLSYGADLEFSVERNGIIHAFWTDEGVLYYSQRNELGNWSEPEFVTTDVDHIRMTLDQNEIHHFLLERDEDLFYLFRQNDGTWSNEENLNVWTGEPVDSWKLLVGSDQTIHVTYASDRKIFYVKRTINGNWTNPLEISHGGLSSVYGNDVEFLLNPQNLPYITYSERIGDQLQYAGYLSFQHPDGIWTIGQVLDDEAIVDKMAFDGNGTLHMIFRTRTAYGERSRIYYQRLDSQGVFSPPFSLANNNSHIEDIVLMHRAEDGHIIVLMNYNYIKVGYFEIGLDGSLSRISNLISDPIDSELAQAVIDRQGVIHLLLHKWITPSGTYQNEYRYTSSYEASETGDSKITQEFTISSDMPNPTLSYLYQLQGASSNNHTWFQVQILDDLGATELISTTQNTGSWVHVSHDMSQWVGETITIIFTTHEEAGAATVSLHLDEVTVGSTYPDIWVTANPQETNVLPGQNLQYTLVYGNQGGATAENVTLTNLLPPGFAFVSADPAPTSLSSEIVWVLGNIEPKSDPFTIQVTLTVEMDIQTLVEVLNSFEITTTSEELEFGNDFAEFEIFIGLKQFLPGISR